MSCCLSKMQTWTFKYMRVHQSRLQILALLISLVPGNKVYFLAVIWQSTWSLTNQDKSTPCAIVAIVIMRYDCIMILYNKLLSDKHFTCPANLVNLIFRLIDIGRVKWAKYRYMLPVVKVQEPWCKIGRTKWHPFHPWLNNISRKTKHTGERDHREINCCWNSERTRQLLNVDRSSLRKQLGLLKRQTFQETDILVGSVEKYLTIYGANV